MRKNKLQAANLEGNADDVEAAFYEAMQKGDIDRLMACWADEDDIVCIHPGGPRLVGAAAIRGAFEAMFGTGAIYARPENVRKIETVGSEVHHLVERVEVLTPQGPRTAWVIATNVYIKTAQGWRLAVHHTSPGHAAELSDLDDAPQVLH